MLVKEANGYPSGMIFNFVHHVMSVSLNVNIFLMIPDKNQNVKY